MTRSCLLSFFAALPLYTPPLSLFHAPPSPFHPVRYAADVDPPLSPAQQYVSNSMDVLGYCHLLAVGSVDGLVEASRQSRVCAGAANPVSCAIFRCVFGVLQECGIFSRVFASWGWVAGWAPERG